MRTEPVLFSVGPGACKSLQENSSFSSNTWWFPIKTQGCKFCFLEWGASFFPDQAYSKNN